jgi:hypothetical protein
MPSITSLIKRLQHHRTAILENRSVGLAEWDEGRAAGVALAISEVESEFKDVLERIQVAEREIMSREVLV